MGLGKWSNWVNFFTRVGPGFFFKKLFLRLFPQRIRAKSKVCQKICDSISASCTPDVLKYLKKKYLPVIEQCDYQESSERIGPTSNIWMLWWQGYENAPDIVKACIASIRKNAGSHPVVLLDQYNYTQYTTLPDHVIDSYEKGHMMLAHLSDFIRTSLLYEHGGIWMDATMYMLHPFDEIVENRTFYTIRGWYRADNPSEDRFSSWTDPFLACGRGNHILGWLNKLLSEYWRQEETFYYYSLLNAFIYTIYWNVESAKKMIDDVPASNSNLFGLQYILNESRDKLKLLQDDGNYLYKLTHRKEIVDSIIAYEMNFLDSVNGEETVYHMLVHEGWDGSV